MSTLENRYALVTGGSRGIGAAIARRLAAEGATVAVNYARSAEAADEVVKEIESKGGRARAMQADVGDAASIESLFAQIDDAFGGRLDILVNNAGVFGLHHITEVATADIERYIAINVRGVMLAAMHVVRRMPDEGRIITIGSVNADRSLVPGNALYSMSKSALQGFTRGLARDLGARKITANLLQPGPVDTDMNPADGEMAEQLAPMTALGRYGHPREIADVVAFIASPEASYITGAVIDVDGGLVA